MTKQIQTRQQFEKAGLVVEVDDKYLTDTGRILYRCWIGKRHSTMVWRAEGENHNYRNFFEAYHGYYYD